MTKSQITKTLIKIHKKYSGERHSNENAQMCTLWSVYDPPDILEDTAPFNELVKAFNFDFSEDEAVEFYDMNISDAAAYIFNLLQKK